MSGAAAATPILPVNAISPGTLRLRLVISQLILLIAIGLAWEYLLAPLIGVNWISRPSEIYDRLTRLIASGDLLWHLQATLTAAFIGYAIGGAAALASAFLIGSSVAADDVSRPFVTAGYSFPKEAIAPVFIIFFGIGLGPKIALAALSVYFIVYQNAIAGVRLVDPDLTRVMRIMGANRVQLFTLVIAPASAPWIFTGLRLAVRYAFTAVIFGEMLSGNRGLGYLVKYAANLFDAAGVFAALASVMLVSVALTATLQAVERTVGR
jgi:NitT/TauT family transport system permease protein